MAIDYRVCPNCDSKNFIKILYGYPNEEGIILEAAGKVKLGGCLVFNLAPEYHCKDCEYEWNIKDAIYHSYQKIKGLNISIGGFHQGHQEVSIDFITGELKYSHSLDKEKNFSITLYPDVLENFRDKLIDTNILNWKRSYYDNDILDGTQWEIEIIREGKNLKRYGSNEYPEEWEKFHKLIGEISGNVLFNY